MANQISVEAEILIKLVRDLYIQSQSDMSGKINVETLLDAIKICDRLDSLLRDNIEAFPRLSE